MLRIFAEKLIQPHVSQNCNFQIIRALICLCKNVTPKFEQVLKAKLSLRLLTLRLNERNDLKEMHGLVQ